MSSGRLLPEVLPAQADDPAPAGPPVLDRRASRELLIDVLAGLDVAFDEAQSSADDASDGASEADGLDDEEYNELDFDNGGDAYDRFWDGEDADESSSSDDSDDAATVYDEADFDGDKEAWMTEEEWLAEKTALEKKKKKI